MPLAGYLIVWTTIKQDRTPLVDSSAAAHRNMPSNDYGGSAVNHNLDVGTGKTIVRARVEHGIQVSLNPLVAPTVTLLFQDMVVNVSQVFSCQ